MSRPALLVALLGVAACFHDLPPKGAVYFVAPGGDDGEVGTVSRPFKTIRRAATILRPGDAVYLRAGTYPESLGDLVLAGTSWDHAVTLAAYPGESVVIKPDPGAGRAFEFYGTGYVVIEGLTLDGGNLAYEVVKAGCSADEANRIIPGSCAHHLRFKDTRFVNAGGNCAFIMGDYHELIGVEASGCKQGLLNLAGNHILIERSSFHDAAWGIQFYDGSGGASLGTSNNVFRGNRLFQIGLDPQLAPDSKGPALGVYGGTGNQIYNNLIYRNTSGVMLATGTDAPLVAHNTIHGNQGFGLDATASRGAVIRNNIATANGSNQLQGTDAVIGDNITEKDPGFVDAARDMFQLQEGSDALDRVGVLPEVATDFAGVQRPQGPAADLGALERVP